MRHRCHGCALKSALQLVEKRHKKIKMERLFQTKMQSVTDCNISKNNIVENFGKNLFKKKTRSAIQKATVNRALELVNSLI